MRAVSLFLAVVGALLPVGASAQGEVSVERGLQISVIGGCHDCHTEGYSEAEGKIDPEKALKGSSVGWRGPWGTTYPANLRIIASTISERGFVVILKNMRSRPPMPWYNLRAMEESDMQSLYQYIKSLGEPGEQVPGFVPADQEPTTPYIPIAPPRMPKD